MSPDIILATIKIVGVFVGVSFIVFWVGLVWWVSQDVLTRTQDKIIVSVAVALTAILGPVGILIYLVVRPRQTLKERLGEVMEQEMLLQASAITICPTCEHLAQEDFLACPHCGTILKKACVSCTKLLAMDWDHCPYCSQPQPAMTIEVTELLMEEPLSTQKLDSSANVSANRPVLEVVRSLINRRDTTATQTVHQPISPSVKTSKSASSKSPAKKSTGKNKKERSGGKKH